MKASYYKSPTAAVAASASATAPMPLPPGKFLDSTNFDFSTSMVIKPPFEQATNDQGGPKYTRIVIDSRDRDTSIYPNSNNYVVDLETEVLEVTSGEVIIKDISMSMYTINSYNDTLLLRILGNDNVVKLPNGDYVASSFAPVLADALNALNASLPESHPFTVTHNVSKDTYTISVDAVDATVATVVDGFSLDFQDAQLKQSNIALLLGFVPGNIYESVSNVLAAPFRTNFDADRYVVMRIDQFTVNNSATSTLHKSTALIGKVDVLSLRTIIPIKKYFNPPIARMFKLAISFTDYYGNPYEFNNKDHRLEIMLESKRHHSKYTSFV